MFGSDGRECQYQVPNSGRGYRSSAANHISTANSNSSTSVSAYNSNLLCNSSQSLISSLLSSAGICFLVVTYTVLGAITFMTLEGHHKGADISFAIKSYSRPNSGDDKLRLQTVEKLWSITEDLNILYKENWTRLAEKEVKHFQDILVRRYRNFPNGNENRIWSFPSSFLYSLTLITTIGYGSISPQTTWGRIMTVIYALIGIPLMLVYLSTVGDSLAKYIRNLYKKINNGSTQVKNKEKQYSQQNHISNKKPPATVLNEIKFCPTNDHLMPSYSLHNIEQHRQRIPLLFTFSIIVVYISAGALLFKRLENWTFLEGSYFCFTSLGTIGFGELIPGMVDSDETVSVFISSAYILIGMAVIAMCFNLVQDETILLVNQVNLWMATEESVTNQSQEIVSTSAVSS